MESLKDCINGILGSRLLNLTVSGPRKADSMKRYDVRPVLIRNRLLFQMEAFDGTQVFHENLDREGIMNRLEDLLPDYRNVEIATSEEDISARISKKGKTSIRRRRKENASPEDSAAGCGAPLIRLAHNRTKKYILPEGTPVPFLVDLGVMSEKGQIIRKKYDKFRQINRFLEFIDDILPAIEERRDRKGDGEITILDFGCGKSYLTFAMYYYLHVLKKNDIRIIGLDRKKKVIRDCRKLAEKYGYEKLSFLEGNIEDYEGLTSVDMVVTLHACDTATDYALAKAVRWGAKVILSVPCCQHELNGQFQAEAPLAILSEHGILQERFSALATDALRAKMLETKGYRTQILEFIDMEHTPKNILIRAVLREREKTGADSGTQRSTEAVRDADAFCRLFGFRPAIMRLLEEGDRNER